MANQEYITRPHLKNRGWTDGMIKKFLGDADMTKPNPHYKSAAPMCLWSAKRVNQAERSDAWKAEREKSVGRKAAAQKGVQTKTDKAKEYAQTVEIHVPVMEYDKVVERACKSYNEWHQYDRHGYINFDFIEADPTAPDKDFLHRITMNYLRHECTEYEQQLYKLFGKTGVNEAHDILQRRINDEIMRVYPKLKQSK